MTSITTRLADLEDDADQQTVVDLIDAYASDPMGRGEQLSEEVKQRLLPGLRNHPTTLIVLAYYEGEPAGIALCFLGFSSFRAQSLLNIHDLAVLPEFRSRGIGRQLLQAVEQLAKDRNCWGVTLEVDERNKRARQTYAAAGFLEEHFGPGGGRTFFLKKPVS